MNTSETALISFPEWYNLERNTGKTINRLLTIKELDFYLKNSNEFIRRLAILRICELKLKDSVVLLKEILDDRLESKLNKELAAWTIKVVSLRWDMDLFFSDKLLNRYTGRESHMDLFKVSITDTSTSPAFDFPKNLIRTELKTDNCDIRLSTEIDFDMPFPTREWLTEWRKSFASALGTVILNLPRKILIGLKITFAVLLKCIFIKMPKFVFITIKGIYVRVMSKSAPHNRYKNYNSPDTNPFRLVKNMLLKALYILFAPQRILLKYRRMVFIMLITLYCYLSFTAYGNQMTDKYLGNQFLEMNSKLLFNAQSFLRYAWLEMKDITGFESSPAKPVIKPDDPSKQFKIYRVTARTGLNLRKAPGTDSDKVMDIMLPLGSVVSFLSKSQNDQAGNLWFFVRTQDGSTGWVYSRWLEETGGGLDAGNH